MELFFSATRTSTLEWIFQPPKSLMFSRKLKTSWPRLKVPAGFFLLISTAPVTLTALVNLNHWCDQKKEAVTAQSVKQLLVKMKDLLQAEFPSCGSKEKMIRQAHMLHPYYKGLLLQKFGEFENTKKEMIDEHQSTADFLPQQRTTVSENLFAGNYFMKNKTNEPEFEVLSSLPILI